MIALVNVVLNRTVVDLSHCQQQQSYSGLIHPDDHTQLLYKVV